MIISKRVSNWTTFVKEVFVLVFSLKSDEMTALLPNDSLTFTSMSDSQKAYQNEQLL